MSTTMMPLSTFLLPLPPSGPPLGYDWEERDMSTSSSTAACITGIDARDKFFGRARCIICGEGRVAHCHIIMERHKELWRKLKTLNWIPRQAKSTFQHEPRDGLLMCCNHRRAFYNYDFFIRFFPDIRKFVFVNFSGDDNLQQFHGKAIALDMKDHHAPFPSLFIIHEMRVRGYHPFQPIAPAMPDDIPWQDWISSDGVFDNETDTFNRDPLPDNGSVPP
ncbi:hypothetical protein BDR04DRAFT_1150510 [Suillus decipiens]|nr:hypothetical protein BDR04DRAFT_1150510 [Suillus decipiens]